MTTTRSREGPVEAEAGVRTFERETRETGLRLNI